MCSETSKHSWCPPQACSPPCHTTWQENGLMDTNKEAIVTLFTHMMLINSKVWPPKGHVVFFPNRQVSNNSRRTWSSHSHMPRSQGKTKEKPVICSELVLPKRAFVYDYVYLIYSEKFNWKNDPFFFRFHTEGIIMIKQSHTSYWSKHSPWLQKKSLSIKSSRKWVHSSALFAELIRMYIMRRCVPCH